MGKFDGILMCTDLDGTLLKKDKNISTENKKAIEYFKNEGGLFTFVTGRSASTVGDMYNIVKPNAPFGCMNGGGIYDGEKKEYIWQIEMDKSVLEIIKKIDEEIDDAGILVYTFDKIYFCRENDITEWFIEITKAVKYVAKYDEIKEDFAKIVFCFDGEEEYNKLVDIFKNHPMAGNFECVRSEKHLFEILPKGSGKGKSIEKLSEIYNIEDTVAIGDFFNDIPMFEKAKVSVAVANACEEAKMAADYVTVSNEEDAIAKIIYDIEKENITFDRNEDKDA